MKRLLVAYVLAVALLSDGAGATDKPAGRPPTPKIRPKASQLPNLLSTVPPSSLSPWQPQQPPTTPLPPPRRRRGSSTASATKLPRNDNRTVVDDAAIVQRNSSPLDLYSGWTNNSDDYEDLQEKSLDKVANGNSVYRALHTPTGRSCLIKASFENGDSPEYQAVRRIIDQRFRHPNVVQYYHCFSSGTTLYIVMEYLENFPRPDLISVDAFPKLRRPGGAPFVPFGTTMLTRYAGRTFTRPAARQFTREFMVAVAALRKLGIIHDDLSSNNVVIASRTDVDVDASTSKGHPERAARLVVIDLNISKTLPSVEPNDDYLDLPPHDDIVMVARSIADMNDVSYPYTKYAEYAEYCKQSSNDDMIDFICLAHRGTMKGTDVTMRQLLAHRWLDDNPTGESQHMATSKSRRNPPATADGLSSAQMSTSGRSSSHVTAPSSSTVTGSGSDRRLPFPHGREPGKEGRRESRQDPHNYKRR